MTTSRLDGNPHARCKCWIPEACLGRTIDQGINEKRAHSGKSKAWACLCDKGRRAHKGFGRKDGDDCESSQWKAWKVGLEKRVKKSEQCFERKEHLKEDPCRCITRSAPGPPYALFILGLLGSVDLLRRLDGSNWEQLGGPQTDTVVVASLKMWSATTDNFTQWKAIQVKSSEGLLPAVRQEIAPGLPRQIQCLTCNLLRRRVENPIHPCAVVENPSTSSRCRGVSPLRSVCCAIQTFQSGRF